MNLENNPSPSGLEKIQALKKEQELRLLREEEKKKLLEESEERTWTEALQKEKQSIAKLLSRKDEVLKKLEEIKLRRGSIISVGHQAVTEAKEDKDIESILRTEEGFNDIFSQEKAEWHALRDSVESLNKELNQLEISISEKETKTEELFLNTKEGKLRMAEIAEKEAQEKDEKIAEKYIDRSSLKLESLKKGEFNFNIVRNLNELVTKDDNVQEETLQSIKNTLHRSVEESFKSEYMDTIRQDFDKLEEYHARAREIKDDAERLFSYLQELPEQYKELLENNEEARGIISRYGISPREVDDIIYRSNDARYALQKVKQLKDSLAYPQMNELYNLDSVELYTKRLREYNDFLLKSLRENNVSEIKKLFGSVESPYTEGLYSNKLEQTPNRFKNPQFFKGKTDFKEAKGEYEKMVVTQEKTEHDTNALLDAGVDYLVANEVVRKLNPRNPTVDSLQKEKDAIAEEKEAAKILLPNIEAYKQKNDLFLEKKIELRSLYPVNIMNQETERRSKREAALNLEKAINQKEGELKDLEAKKLGLFDSKSKHSANIDILKKEIEDLSRQKEEAVLEAKRLESDILNITPLFKLLPKKMMDSRDTGLYLKEVVGISNGMTVDEALNKLTEYLTSLSQTEFPIEKEKSLKRFKETRELFSASQKTLALANA